MWFYSTKQLSILQTTSQEDLLNVHRVFTAPAKPENPTVVAAGEPAAFIVTYNFGIGGGWTHEFKVLYRKKGEKNWKLKNLVFLKEIEDHMRQGKILLTSVS